MLTTCFHCNAEHRDGHYERVVHNKTALYGPWAGWRMAGRFLVAPDRERITPERLRGIMWRDSNTKASKRHDQKPRMAVISPLPRHIQRSYFVGHGSLAIADPDN